MCGDGKPLSQTTLSRGIDRRSGKTGRKHISKYLVTTVTTTNHFISGVAECSLHIAHQLSFTKEFELRCPLRDQ